MKKNIPYLIPISYVSKSNDVEDIPYIRFLNMVEDGYRFPKHDFDLFCAIKMRIEKFENLSKDFQNYIRGENKVRDEVRFQMIRLADEKNEVISNDDLEYYKIRKTEEALKRKEIVKKEITKTNTNFKKLTPQNSKDFRILVSMIRTFSDITILDGFTPITLTFERFVHIYVKHVEETKISQGQFKQRTFFDYNHSQIFKLLQIIIHKEHEDIEEHFLEVRMGRELGKQEKIKDYHRGFKSFKPVFYNDDKFALTIDHRGFIRKFHQLKEPEIRFSSIDLLFAKPNVDL